MSGLVARILVPTDGSELADRILAHVDLLARPGGTELHFLRVVSAHGSDPVAIKTRFDEARAQLEALEKKVARWGVKTKVALASGDPAEEILAYADSIAPTLIAMSTHGRTGIKRWIRGSVAERILRECHHPLLLASPFGLDGRSKPAWRRILVPLDGSPRSAAILTTAHEIAKTTGAELVLFHSVEHTTDESAEEAVLTRSEAESLLENAQKLVPDVASRIVVAYGQPADAILRAVKKEKPDLVAMNSRGRSGVSRWVLGSVAEQVLRECECPVLVERPRRRGLDVDQPAPRREGKRGAKPATRSATRPASRAQAGKPTPR